MTNLMQSSENAALLCLSVPVALDDEIADFLLNHPALISGFTSVSANGMGPNSIFGSIMEQVQGKSRRQLFMSEAPLGKITSLLTLLQDAYQGADIHYWITPVLQSGSLR
ncbi:DUF3240 family protein [Undibacterium squillarum]|uniref:DUF3240 domain-containing protein n=1 Tax=Undibacterium squillarum TaxID=1131567 RepID=A0ABQ2XWQ9_9BURK|nr:DUF3240 family protein [Undibacterium squillarum]GGX38362.1 hypothetical protein GCM10010946_15750 [Undibacterium squillarum]